MIRSLARATEETHWFAAAETLIAGMMETPDRPPNMRLPYVHLNLRINPFGECDPDERSRLAVVDLPPWRPQVPLQFVGGCGHGKTTHLLALRARHPDARYHRMDLGENRLPRGIPDASPLIVDEAQRLCASLLQRLVLRQGKLALAAHDDLSPTIGRPLDTVWLAGWTLERLRSIVARRIEWARRGSGPVPTVSDHLLQALLLRHGDDLRSIEWALYDRFQKLEDVSHVEM